MSEHCIDFDNYAREQIENGISLLQPNTVALAKEHGYIITGAKNFLRGLQTYNAASLMDMDLQPPPFIVQHLLPIGLTVFAAPPKIGKSWLCLDICCAVASGESFWACPTNSGNVLYLDLESRKWRINDRFKAMRRSIPKGLEISHEAARIDAGLLSQLKDWSKKAVNPRLIVIDTIGRIKNGARRGENSYEADSRMFSPLQTFAIEKQLSIIAVTHLRKSNGISLDDPFERIMGSTGLFGIADSAWMITGKRLDHEKIFLATGRDYDPVENTIAFNRDICRWEMLGDSDALAETREKAAYDASSLVVTIKKLLSENGGQVQVTAQDLFVRCGQDIGIYPADTPGALGKHIRKISPLLLKYDKIYYIEPNPNGGARGRKHVFSNYPQQSLFRKRNC